MAARPRGDARRRARARAARDAKNPAKSAPPGSSTRWTRWIAYSLLALYAVIWGVKAFTEHRIGNFAVETDFYWKYGPAASDLLQGKIAIENYDSKGWGYPAAVALVSLFGVDPFGSAQIVALLCAVLVGWCLYRLHRSFLGPGVALASLLLLLANETFLANTYQVGTDMFFFAIVLGSIALLLGRGNPGALAMLFSGLLGGWAFSTRYNGLFLWPGALLLLLVVRTAEGSLASRLRRAGVWSAGFVAAALPWLIVNAIHTGHPLTNSNWVNIGYAVYGEGNWEKFFYGGDRTITSFADVVLLDPGRFAGAMMRNVVEHMRRDLSELIPVIWGALAVIGSLFLLRERPGRRVAGYGLLWLLYFLTLVPVFYGARFSLPLLAWWLLLAAWPFVSNTVGRPLRSIERSFPLRAFAFLALWLTTAVQAYQWTEDPQNPESLRAGPYEVLPAVTFLRERGPGEALLARKPHAAFMAKMRFVPIPEFDTPASLHAIAEKERVRYLLVSGAELGMRAGMRPFATGEDIPGFARVFESPGAWVYEVREVSPSAQAP